MNLCLSLLRPSIYLDITEGLLAMTLSYRGLIITDQRYKNDIR
jgi:hypothetical protein